MYVSGTQQCYTLPCVTHYLVLHITLCYTLPCVTQYLVLHITSSHNRNNNNWYMCTLQWYTVPNVIQSTHHTQLLMLQAVCLMYVSANKSPRKCSNVFHMSHDNNFHWITTYKRHLKNITWWECVCLWKPTKKWSNAWQTAIGSVTLWSDLKDVRYVLLNALVLVSVTQCYTM